MPLPFLLTMCMLKRVYKPYARFICAEYIDVHIVWENGLRCLALDMYICPFYANNILLNSVGLILLK